MALGAGRGRRFLQRSQTAQRTQVIAGQSQAIASGLRSFTSGGRFFASGARFFAASVANPTYQRFARYGLLLLLAVWVLISLWRGLISFIPETAGDASVTVINPVVTPASSAVETRRQVIDVDQLAAVDLFGTPGEVLSPQQLALANSRSAVLSEDEASTALAGIEDDAPETRLPIVLRGVVASSAAGLGQAVIEYQKQQALYRVGDELPLSGEVVLAKVLPDRVVVENSGRYELLRLFENSDLVEQVRSVASPVPQRASMPSLRSGTPSVVGGQSANAAEIAAKYREQLYSSPESLADVVRITPLRQDGVLKGYRIAPGKAGQEFAALGFKTGDIVTEVNGLALSDPANTVRLYQAMRSAEVASFEITRKGEPVTLNVDIGRAASRKVEARQ